MITKPRMLLGFKVIGLIDGLSREEARALCVVLDHLNQFNGRCDPSIQRVAKLLGISDRTVARATAKGEKLGLLTKVRHGGVSLSNQHVFNWPMFEEFEAQWKRKKKSINWTRLSGESSQDCQNNPANSVDQTCPNNQSNRTSTEEHKTQTTRKLTRLTNNRFEPASVSSADAERASAIKRWSDALNRNFANSPEIYSKIIQNMGPELQEAATQAELLRRHSGVRVICEALSITIP